ncbi:molybdopterin dehydrogenase FAD-binding protein [Halosimplex carlsbadense 2-9-1]|uniref:Molybdopterin dehydrogenase FAD-binding protein n=1 Tax=Halosimplex carlsbadense 2-9-1 TaxID=797114 RepID=M0D1Z5_9EURY|nr:xanthine dehydrogenase family protein subunit M [Halosimplex carlsbadense]ELZ29501.1 molybdopterin dehydrogenase FAD-binding protein [Halosimplex carlsbadense 2-9-1]
MFPAAFDYERAESVGEALDLLEEHGDADVEILAGGHSLVPAMKTEGREPDVVVDLDVPALDAVNALDDRTVVGALTTYATLVDAGAVRSTVPLVAETASEVGDTQIRNRGTIGGNLAAAHPGADLPAAALASDAVVLLRDRDGKREVPVTDFFRGDGETAVERGELLTGVRIPHTDEAGFAYAKKTHPATGYAMVGVAAVVETDGPGGQGSVSRARVAATGAVDRAVRLPAVEESLVDGPLDSAAIDAAASEARVDIDPGRLRSDAYASGEFRGELLETYVARALETAAERVDDDALTA